MTAPSSAHERRIADGVVAITQYDPSDSWASTITQIRAQLSAAGCY